MSILGKAAEVVESTTQTAEDNGSAIQAVLSKPVEKLPDIIAASPTPRAERRFTLETEWGFSIEFSDCRPRAARGLPYEAIKLFRDAARASHGHAYQFIDLPTWLFACEIMGDHIQPSWIMLPIEGVTQPRLGGLLSRRADEERHEFCYWCGRSLFWVDGNGNESCVCCRPAKFKEDVNSFVKRKGHPQGCDWS